MGILNTLNQNKRRERNTTSQQIHCLPGLNLPFRSVSSCLHFELGAVHPDVDNAIVARLRTNVHESQFMFTAQ